MNYPHFGDHFRRCYQTASSETLAATWPCSHITLGRLVTTWYYIPDKFGLQNKASRAICHRWRWLAVSCEHLSRRHIHNGSCCTRWRSSRCCIDCSSCTRFLYFSIPIRYIWWRDISCGCCCYCFWSPRTYLTSSHYHIICQEPQVRRSLC